MVLKASLSALFCQIYFPSPLPAVVALPTRKGLATCILTARPFTLYDSLHMDNRFSCTASVSTSMGSDDGSTSSSSASAESMTELCCKFDRQSLQPSRQNIMEEHYLASRSRKLHTPVHSNRMPTSFNSSHAVLQQRHLPSRRQPNSAQLNKIHTLVEDLLSGDQLNTIASSSSTSANITSPLPLDMLPPYAAYMMTSTTSSMSSASEADEPDSSRDQRRRYLHHKVSKDLRHSASRETMGKPNVVLKSIRVRKGFLKRRSQESASHHR